MARSSTRSASLNHLGGRSVPAQEGRTYERRAPGVRGEGVGASLGHWPRSGRDDVRHALDLAATRDWGDLRPHERGERLRLAARGLASTPDPDGRAAEALGLSASELRPHTLGLEGKLSASIRSGLSRGEAAGVTVIRPHWSLLWAGLGGMVMEELAAGRRVILLPGPEAACIADQLSLALEEVELPEGSFALLHDDGRNALRAAVEEAGEARLLVAGAAEDEKDLRSWIDDRPGRGAEGDLPFGAGVSEERRPRLEFEALGVRGVRIAEDDDPGHQARRVALAALGRGPTLSGQLPGHVRHVRCHPALFSDFTASLLEELEEAPELVPPVPVLDARLPGELEQIRELGLAEGATLIQEGPRSDSRRASRGATMAPLVFTNVDPRMRLAAVSRPGPVLLLMRSAKD